jgi:1-acyl-sn-glycerol-3-phosphate acyltransferase
MGFAYAITLDGDGQHYPTEIGRFLSANREHPGAMILGSRRTEALERQSKGSSFAHRFSNFWCWVQTGRRLSDTQTGYRLYPLKRLRGLNLLTSRYEAELELLVFASWHGTDIVELHIDVYYPPKEQRVSHFRPGMDFVRISILNTVLCGMAVVYGLPLRLFRWVMKYVRTVYALLFFLFFMFIVVKPAVWLYLKVGKMTEQKRTNLHKLIYRASRFVMLTHGIPGVKFSYGICDGVTFDRPRVIICNHQSHLDLFCQLIFTPNMVFLTNDWVWNNPSYGLLIRNAEYYPVREGLEELLPKLQSLVERGYSIAIYPEGTRSKDCRI